MSDDKKPIALLLPARTSVSFSEWQDKLRKASRISPTISDPDNDNRIIIPTPEEVRNVTSGFIGPKSKRRRLGVVAGMHSSTPSKPYLKRYGALLIDKDGRRRAGKIITEMEIEDWAKKNEYTVVRSFRLFGIINPEKEHTEIAD
jgi:hypothetical protein